MDTLLKFNSNHDDKGRFAVDPAGIASSLEEAGRAHATAQKRVTDALDKLPDGYKIQQRKNKVWEKQTVPKGPVFWTDGKKNYSSRELLENVGTKIIPHVGEGVYYGKLLKYNEHHDDRGRFSTTDVPSEAGKSPIPEGRVRRFHYTFPENAEKIAKEGIQISHSTGVSNREPVAVWSNRTPEEAGISEGGYINSGHAVVEFHDDPKNYESNPYASSHSVPAKNIVAIHQPWHAHYRYAVAENLPSSELRGVGGKEYTQAADALDHHRIITKLAKFNPYHLPTGPGGGQFTSGGGGGSRSFRDATRRNVASPMLARDQIADEFRPVIEKQKLTGSQKSAVETYQGSTYRDINSVLRHNIQTGMDKTFNEQDIRGFIKEIDGAFRSNTLPEDLVLWRGGRGTALADLKPGDLLHDAAYVSASANEQVAQNFALAAGFGEAGKGRSDTAVLYKINVPKGSPAIMSADANAFDVENEVILPRNSVFRVESVASSKIDIRTGAGVYGYKAGPWKDKDFVDAKVVTLSPVLQKEGIATHEMDGGRNRFIWEPGDFTVLLKFDQFSGGGAAGGGSDTPTPSTQAKAPSVDLGRSLNTSPQESKARYAAQLKAWRAARARQKDAKKKFGKLDGLLKAVDYPERYYDPRVKRSFNKLPTGIGVDWVSRAPDIAHFASKTHHWLQQTKQNLIKQLRGNLAKATPEKEEEWKRLAEEIALALQLGDAELLVNDVESITSQEASDAVSRTLVQLGVPDDSNLFNSVSEDMVGWAHDRAAEMVGMKWEDGALVPSANAEMRIDETTRDMVQSIIEDGLADGKTQEEIADELANLAGDDEEFVFSEDRANLIAATEVANAASQGALTSAKAARDEDDVVSTKFWLVADDPCPICEENEAAGDIPLDEDFPSGDDAPTAHPNCRCAVAFRAELPDGTKEDDQEEEPINLYDRGLRHLDVLGSVLLDELKGNLLKFNPNHDEKGRFASAGGQGDMFSSATKDHINRLHAAATYSAIKQGYDASKVMVVEHAPEFSVDGVAFKPAAIAVTADGNPDYVKGSVVVFADQFKHGKYETVPGIMAHEIQHQKFQEVLDRATSGPGPASDAMRVFDTQEVKLRLAQEDGISNYSAMWWNSFYEKPQSRTYVRAVHETLAEMARVEREQGVAVKELGLLPNGDLKTGSIAPVWQDLYHTVNTLYTRQHT